MDDKYIVIINAQNKKNYIKYFSLDKKNEPVIKYLNAHKGKYQNIIYLTDGGCPAPTTKPARPILWVISESGIMGDDLPGAKVQIKR